MSTVAREYAVVGWTIGDVQTIYKDMTDEQAVKWLVKNEKLLRDRTIEHGWSVIEDIGR